MADLVSSQVLQKTLDELRNITRIDLCVTNTDGVLLVTTFPETAIDAESIRSFVLSAADSQIVQEYHYFKVYDNQNVEYILISKGSSDDAYMIGKVAVCEIQNLIIAYKERLDKNNFIQNLLLDNLLLVDVYNRAKKLRIDTDVRRVVYMVETKLEKDISAQETVKSLFASRPRDFITAVDEKSIIIVKELKDTDTFEDMNQTARMLVDMLNAEAMSQEQRHRNVQSAGLVCPLLPVPARILLPVSEPRFLPPAYRMGRFCLQRTRSIQALPWKSPEGTSEESDS